MSFRLRQLPLVVAALCMAMSPALQAQVQPGALPGGWNVTSGNAAISRNGTTLNINQTTQQALVNFSTFNVGSGAVVDIRQPNASSALLARTTGGDPSQIDGQIKANGALWLINPAGIMVGAGARIDVGSFVASTLNVSDSDFLAGKLTFKSGATTASEVRNAGTINAASGGSIYLVAPSVANTGTLNAPNGEVLLAAGQNVQLIDTGTPGVSVSITGTQGEVRNLGRIVAEAGRIGLAAGLVSNSGSINADSVVSEGGRVFLRASGDLKTTAASDISASGTTGGRVELIADGAASIDGRIAATGSAGKGGYVDTSGHHSLDVVNVPVVGRGGEWHIDPDSIDIVASGGDTGVSGTGAIVSTASGASINASTIDTQLNSGTNVSITTGPGYPPTDQGNITVSAPIVASATAPGALTLNASNNILINAPISSTSGALTLNLNSNYQNDYPTASHAVQLNANLDLFGGALNVSESGGSGNGTLNIASGTTLLNTPTSAINAATVNVAAGATLVLNRAGSAISGSVNNDGTVSVGGTGTALLDHGGAHTGNFDVASTAGLSMSGGQTFNTGTTFTGSGTVEWAGSITLGSSLLLGPGSNPLVLHDTSLFGVGGSTLSTQGAGVVVDGQVVLYGSAGWTNGTSVAVVGNGAISASNEGTRLQNDGTITTSGTQANALRGDGAGVSNFVNNGTLVKAGATDQQYTGFGSTAGSVVRADAGSLTISGAQLDGQVQVASGAHVTLGGVALNSDVVFSGAGTMGWQNYISLLGSVDIGAGAPVLSLATGTAIQGLGTALTTHNVVNADGALVYVQDETVWNNYGTVSLGAGSPSTLIFQGSGAFNNKAGGTLNVAAQSQVTMVAGSVITNDANATLNIASGSVPTFSAGDLGQVANSGTLLKSGSSATFAPLTNLAGGTVQVNQGELDVNFKAANANSGAVVLQSGTTLGSGGADIYNNGRISGTGTIAMGGVSGGTLFNNGTVSPGTSSTVGTLAVQGGYTQGSGGVLDIQLGGLAAGAFDLLDIDGSARLGGTLNISTLGTFAPANATYGDFIVARGGNSGVFDQVVAPPVSWAGGVATFSVSYPAPGTTAARVTAAVVPSMSACIANPAAAGCSSVLPSLASCVTNPTGAGCSAVLPTLAACSVSPTLAGCSVVLPPLARCTATPSLAGCSSVLPSLASCSATPMLPGCAVVLPSLASCVANPTGAGCSAVLPTLAACSVSPTLAGCASVLPTLAQCAAATTAPGCSAVLPPGTQVNSSAPVTQALNTTVNLINSVQTSAVTGPPQLVATNSPSDMTTASAGSSTSKGSASGSRDDTGSAKDEPAKKMYCN